MMKEVVKQKHDEIADSNDLNKQFAAEQFRFEKLKSLSYNRIKKSVYNVYYITLYTVNTGYLVYTDCTMYSVHVLSIHYIVVYYNVHCTYRTSVYIKCTIIYMF